MRKSPGKVSTQKKILVVVVYCLCYHNYLFCQHGENESSIMRVGGGQRKDFLRRRHLSCDWTKEQVLEMSEHFRQRGSIRKGAEWQWARGCRWGRGQDVASLCLLGSLSSLGTWIADLT